MSFRYKPEDFKVPHGSRILRSYPDTVIIARVANALLEAHKKTLPRVYGTEINWTTRTPYIEDHSNTALLFDIQPIEEKK